MLRVAVCMLCVAQTLAVNRPPNMVMNPEKEIYYKPGESVEIKCIGDGIPKPIYKWKRNGIDFNPSGNDDRVVQLPNQGTIVFNKPEDKDEGIFQCFADNSYGTAVSYTVNFREAKLARFEYAARKITTAYAGDPVTIQCTPPQSFPPADVYWVIKELDGRWQAINFDKRMSMDIEYRLQITNVLSSDHQGGKAYSCMAINYFMRDNAIGPEHEINVIGSTAQKHPAAELWTSPSDQFFVKGGLIKLKCIFSGNPTPDVYWEKIGGTLPDRAAFKSFGQELHITNVQESDEGQYECMGLNTESQQRATKAFDVRVESAPEWLTKPESQEKSTNEKVVYHCLAKGNPEPQYAWYINGVPVEATQNQPGVTDPRIHNNPRYSSTPNMMTLKNLTLEDHMNVQCNASNKHGYVFADVYLNVLEEAPTILVPPPPSAKVAEGHSITITCVVTGKPDPMIEWYRDTNLITGGRFKIMPNGNLLISNVVMADAGDYRCQATNKFARDVTSSVCKMQVRRKTRIEQLPLDLEVIAGNDAKFTCSGSTDFDEAGNMRVYWEKDDKIVSTSENRMTQNFQDNSLTISGTIVRDSGVYTCVITNGLDEDKAYAFLTVKDRPDPPSSVEVERCRENSTDLKWIKGIENNAPVNYFVIQYNTSFNPDQWVSAKTVDYSQNTANIDLQPWVNYTFRVIATNKIGQSAPSFHTKKVCRTNPALPFKNPQNVRAIGDTRGKLKIEWIAMNELDHNGPGFKYQLTVQKEGSGVLETINIDNFRNRSIELDASQPYFPYNVKMQAKNSVGDSRANVNNQTLFSYEDIPSARAQDVQVTEVGDSHAVLTFSWNKNWLDKSGRMTSVLGELRGFKVQFWRTSQKLSTFREEEIPIKDITPELLPEGDNAIIKTEYRLVNLSPFSNMQVQICVTNNYYVGSPSDPVSFTTYEGVPGPVEYFEAQVRSSNSFSLYWIPPAPEDRNGILKGYDIAYQLVEGLELGAVHDRDDQIFDPQATTAVLSGLLPDRKYRVHIYAMTQFGRGEGSFIEVKTTKKSEFSAPDFDIRDITETSFNVTWSPGVYYGAHVVHYIEFRKEGAADWQQSTDEVLTNHKAITNLEKGTYYECRVVAFDGFNRAYSETKVVGTVGFAAARSVAANYGWFIGMLLSGLAFIAIVVFIYWIHRKRKDVEEKPRSKRGAVYKDTRPMGAESDFDRDSREQYNDYYKDDNKYEDYQPDGYEQPDKDKGYVDYKRESYGYERDSEAHYDKRDSDYYKNKGNHRDDYDDDYNRDDDFDPDYDYKDDRYNDYDDDYDRRDRYDEDSYEKDRPPAYRNPSYEDADNYDKGYRASTDDRAFEEYGKDPSKFDDEGVPIPKPPSSTPGGHGSSFV